ncbi:hypothetical protein [Streptomyces coeruleorubidus]|uniref:hypothetical protein n=1 Tax=Streptomyces coeruleorubidus TaxID=116188 RepID=UPI0033BD4F19
MRSARMLLATATATAALAITAPTAYAVAMGDRDHDTTSYSKEHDKDRKHHKPRGGVHTGGGALAAVTADDDWDGSKHDHDGRKDGDHGKHEKDSRHGDKHHKPRGGVHTGGGALAVVNADDDWDKHDHDGRKHDEHGKHDDHGKHEKDSRHGDKHHKPRGGVHTGGGALVAVNADDDWDNPKHEPDGERGEDPWGDKKDEDAYGDKHGKDDEHGKHEEHGKHDDHEKGSWHGDKHHKPRGGMHTGGGGLASAPGVTAGGLAVLAVAGTGLYALRRQKASQGAA